VRVLLLLLFLSVPVFSSPGSICHTSSCASNASLPCGSVPAGSFPALLQAIHSLAEQRRQAKAKDHKKSGFQRTPAFILAVIKDALVQVQQQQQQQACGRQKSMPRGGFTDVGLHTGGMPRPTAWPLVQQTFQVCVQYVGQPCAAAVWAGRLLCFDSSHVSR
jgi:hypothetical protein